MYACDCFLFLSVIHVDTTRPLEFSLFRPRSGACSLFFTENLFPMCTKWSCVCVRAILSHPHNHIFRTQIPTRRCFSPPELFFAYCIIRKILVNWSLCDGVVCMSIASHTWHKCYVGYSVCRVDMSIAAHITIFSRNGHSCRICYVCVLTSALVCVRVCNQKEEKFNRFFLVFFSILARHTLLFLASRISGWMKGRLKQLLLLLPPSTKLRLMPVLCTSSRWKHVCKMSKRRKKSVQRELTRFSFNRFASSAQSVFTENGERSLTHT